MKSTIDFDVILKKIGSLGPYQRRLLLIILVLAPSTAVHNISSVFYSAHEDFRCYLSQLDDVNKYPNLTKTQLLDISTPKVNGKYDTCSRYGYNLSECRPPKLECVNKSAEVISCDNGYHFDFNTFESTTISEWNLVCDRRMYSTTATSFYFIGLWLGAVFFGFIADRYGRRKTILITTIGTIFSGCGVAFSPNFALFVLFRLLTGAFSHGGLLVVFVYVVEITGPMRSVTGIQLHAVFGISYLINSFASYNLRHWRSFYLAISLTPVPYLFLHHLLPESPRWLCSKGKENEGKEIGNYFALKNGRILTEEDWDDATFEQEEPSKNNIKYSSIDLFKQKRMRWITIKIMFCWFSSALVYYGLSLNAGSLSGDIFTNNALSTFIEVGSMLFVQLTIEKRGRRVLLCSMFVLQSVSCLSSTVLMEIDHQDETLKVLANVLAFIGKAGVSASFAIVYNFCAELFPTVVRANALGVSSMASRWGCILAPYLVYLQNSVSWLPMAIFAGVSLSAGLVSLLLPETMGKEMMQTMEEAEEFYAHRRNVKLKMNFGERSRMSNYVKIHNTSDEKQNLLEEAF